MRRLLTLTLTATVAACSKDSAVWPDRPITAVTVTPSTASLVTGDSVRAKATVTGGYSSAVVTWTTSNPAVATVSDSGVIVAKALGTANITAKADTVTALITITVTSGVTSVAVTPGTSSLILGQNALLKATLAGPRSSTPVTWSSSSPAIATVNDSGRVNAIALGTTTITASAGGFSGAAAITVTSGVTSVTVTPGTSSLLLGQVAPLKATLAGPRSSTPVTWSSSSPAIATVNDSGRVNAIALGTTTITASAGGFSGAAAITVITGAVDRVTVCDRSVSGTCGASATLPAINTAVAVRASAYNSLGTDISSSCTFDWKTNTPLIITTTFIAGDAGKRDALITRTGLGITSVIVTCNAIPGVFTINGPVATP